jgi:hypothetical protein
VIDTMTLAEAGEIFRYWEDNPPSHLVLQTIARLLGWQPSRPSPPASLPDLVAAPPPGLAVAPATDIAMPPPILDPATLRTRNRARAANAARFGDKMSGVRVSAAEQSVF